MRTGCWDPAPPPGAAQPPFPPAAADLDGLASDGGPPPVGVYPGSPAPSPSPRSSPPLAPGGAASAVLTVRSPLRSMLQAEQCSQVRGRGLAGRRRSQGGVSREGAEYVACRTGRGRRPPSGAAAVGLPARLPPPCHLAQHDACAPPPQAVMQLYPLYRLAAQR